MYKKVYVLKLYYIIQYLKVSQDGAHLIETRIRSTITFLPNKTSNEYLGHV